MEYGASGRVDVPGRGPTHHHDVIARHSGYDAARRTSLQMRKPPGAATALPGSVAQDRQL